MQTNCIWLHNYGVESGAFEIEVKRCRDSLAVSSGIAGRRLNDAGFVTLGSTWDVCKQIGKAWHYKIYLQQPLSG